MMSECKSCAMVQEQGEVPFVYEDDSWTVNLLLDNTPPKLLLGWMVLQPKKHVNSLSELSLEEQRSFGILLGHCESAMKELLELERVYVCLFAEDPDFHLHIHLIPRRPDLPKEFIGPNIFGISDPEFELATKVEVTELQRQLKTKLLVA